jgi:hypothetical protein
VRRLISIYKLLTYKEGLHLKTNRIFQITTVKLKKQATFLALTLFLTCLLSPATTGNVIVEEKIPVFVGFVGEPQPELIKQYNGEIRVIFHIVNVISANLTRSSIETLSKHPSVAYIEEIATFQIVQQEIPWGVERIQAPQAWNISKGTEVKVAILDTGIDIDWNGSELLIKGGVNFEGTTKDGSTDPKDWTDKNGHGTHVAGILAALDNDQLYVGVAPEVSLYAVKVLGAGGTGTAEDVIQGIEWSVNNSMQIISMSLGGPSNLQTMNDTCKNAYDAGTLLIAASGNDGDGDPLNTDPISYPAAYESVIAVGGTDEDDNVWEKSSTGPHVELSAPATNIPSLWTYPLLATASGTSMATPHVSGVAALVWAALPTYTNDQIRKRLQETATDLGPPGRDPGYGYGIVNASKAVTVHDIAIIQVTPSKTVVGAGYSVNISVLVENQGTKTETFSVNVYYNSSLIDTITNVTLTAGSNVTLTSTWNTTEVNYGNYTISAEALLVHTITDTDPVDNLHIDGFIIVSIPGDINGDGIVNVFDLITLCEAYSSALNTLNWNPEADINNDGVIDTLDVNIFSTYWGETI